VQIKALIFDVDGTMADTEEVHRRAFNEAFQDVGELWHWNRETNKKLLKVMGGKERIRHYIAENHPEDLQRPDLEAYIARIHARKVAIFRKSVSKIRFRPGVARLIHEARDAGIVLAIATTSSRPGVEALIRANLGPDALQWFAVMATNENTPRKKPAPDVFLYALAQLAIPAAQCLVLEDSENGVRACCQAHLPVLVTRNEYTAHHDFTGALAVVSDLGEPSSPAELLAVEPTVAAQQGLEEGQDVVCDLPFLNAFWAARPENKPEQH
jgi:HAD superfamily hydrolase (TIGR01509 family)